MHTIKLSIKPALAILATGSLFIFSCQKKFDASSYKPAESFGGYSSSNSIQSSALIAHFSFEGNLTDSVSKTAADNFGTSFSTGVKGQALQIGLNNYAVFTPTDAIRKLQSMSIAFWMNTPEDAAGIQPFVSFVDSNQFWGNFDMFFDGQTPDSAKLHIHAFGSGGTQETFITNWNFVNPWSVWTHIVLTYDGGSNIFTLYINGAQFASTTVANFGPLNWINFPAIVIGTMQFQTTPSLTSGTTSQPWASNVLGKMDELRIYNAVLGASDIRALYQLETLGE